MASAQVVETSVTNNSPSQDSSHPDDLFQSRYNKIILPKCDNVILVAFFYRLGNLQEEWFTITMLLHVQRLSQSKITVMKYLICLLHQSKILDIILCTQRITVSYNNY